MNILASHNVCLNYFLGVLESSQKTLTNSKEKTYLVRIDATTGGHRFMFRTKKENLYFLFLTSFLWVFALIVTALDFILIQGMTYRLDLLNLIGLIAVLIGVTLGVQARKTLKKYYSPFIKISEDHKLITHGIYKYVRHPAYLGSLFISFGIPLIFSSVYGILAMSLFIPPTLYRIKIEEQMLIETFGNEYLEYCKKVRKLIPYIY